MDTLFYEDNILLVQDQLECLKWEFDVLMEVFVRVVLKTNVKKVVIMFCQT